MVAIWVGLFFVLVSALAWLALFPDARDAVAAGAGRWRHRFGTIAMQWQSRTTGQLGAGGARLRDRGRRTRAWAAQRRYWLFGALALLLAPPLAILATRQQVMLDGFDTGARATPDSRIVQLLRGERLAPPPELPPAVFVAAEAELLQRPASTVAPGSVTTGSIASADRRWQRIAPDFRQRILAIYRVMREQYGYRMVLVEGYRSPERQAELARAGKATNAGAGQSCHQYGLAIDSALFRDGKLQWDMEDPWTRRGYFLYGELAAQAGLEWGGNWRSLKDYVHLELKAECRRARRAAGH